MKPSPSSDGPGYAPATRTFRNVPLSAQSAPQIAPPAPQFTTSDRPPYSDAEAAEFFRYDQAIKA